MIVASCGPSAREKTLRGTFAAIDASRKAFTTWDLKHQEEIVAKAPSLIEGRTQIDAYRAERKALLDAFIVAYRAIAIAAVAQDNGSLMDALAAGKALADAIKKLTGGSLP